jgi:hypothetical protein
MENKKLPGFERLRGERLCLAPLMLRHFAAAVKLALW